MTIVKADPGLADGVYALLGALQQYGLIVPVVPGGGLVMGSTGQETFYQITMPGRRFLDLLADNTDSARMRAGVSTCDGVDGTQPFTGELDELMIFRSALTQPQIQALGRAEGLTCPLRVSPRGRYPSCSCQAMGNSTCPAGPVRSLPAALAQAIAVAGRC